MNNNIEMDGFGKITSFGAKKAIVCPSGERVTAEYLGSLKSKIRGINWPRTVKCEMKNGSINNINSGKSASFIAVMENICLT